MYTVKISFPEENIELEFSKGHKLSDICLYAGFDMELPCGGAGTCGKCKVDIETNGYRRTVLACKTIVTADTKIFIKNEIPSLNILETGTEQNEFHLDPHIKSYVMEKTQFYYSTSAELLLHINKFFKTSIESISDEQFNDYKSIYKSGYDIEFIIHRKNVVKIRRKTAEQKILGLALDIGTTSVVGYLHNLVSGEELGVHSLLNRQKKFGLDVVSRINRALSSPADKEYLKILLVDTVNSIIENITSEASVDRKDIFHIVACGNSAMQNFLFSFDLKFLAVSPYTSEKSSLIVQSASDLNIDAAAECILYFLPLMGGYVGSDALASLLTIPADSKKRLIIDLGTNGEISLGSREKYFVSSTACGPALEGASISNGMRAESGAISNFRISADNPEYSVIGNVRPKGICGSGIIDIIAELIKTGIIDKKGKLAVKSSLPFHPLSDRLTQIDNEPVFIVEYEKNTSTGKCIYINQKDIRQFQLAKSAIYSGCMALIETSGIPQKDIEELLIAGAFGNYINIKNAVMTGLLPNLYKTQISAIGNSAAAGCRMYLLSGVQKEISEKIVDASEYINLATDTSFSKEYIKNMNFN